MDGCFHMLWEIGATGGVGDLFLIIKLAVVVEQGVNDTM